MSRSAITAMRASPGTTPAERAALGKAARRRSPRSGHAVYRPAPDRPDPLTIERDHQTLVDAVRAGRLPAEELPAARPE
ncbi:hypothetical protein ACIPWL_23605 [Streptomyces sp. NPDC090023]|uniref:hypothetical protein n=1 Tax=unclassified Streptomyces TaxID=2593676 RepID=UPI0038110916